MKQLVSLLLLLPLLGLSQTKTVLNGSRYFVMPGNAAAFEKAVGEHAQKYHKGDFAWRVWSIETGPDAGGYMITEGPSDWASIDKRGNLGAEHMDDWSKNIAPLLTNRYQSVFAEFIPSLSTVQLTDYADKIVITHISTKPGRIVATRALFTKMLKVWKEAGESVAVYGLTASGDPGFLYVTRLKNGLAELASDYRKPIEDRFNAAWGSGAWSKYLDDYANAVESRWSEILVYKPELSSK
jgi:hypothetical protein